MFIYNVTVKIDKNIHREWLEWMQQIHIPEVMQTGCFAANRFLRLLESDESGGVPTRFNIQPAVRPIMIGILKSMRKDCVRVRSTSGEIASLHSVH